MVDHDSVVPFNVDARVVLESVGFAGDVLDKRWQLKKFENRGDGVRQRAGGAAMTMIAATLKSAGLVCSECDVGARTDHACPRQKP